MAKKNKVKNHLSIDGVSFSKGFIASHENEAAFLSAMEHKQYAHLFEGENRAEKLKEVYALAAPKVEKKEVEVAKVAPAKSGR